MYLLVKKRPVVAKVVFLFRVKLLFRINVKLFVLFFIFHLDFLVYMVYCFPGIQRIMLCIFLPLFVYILHVFVLQLTRLASFSSSICSLSLFSSAFPSLLISERLMCIINLLLISTRPGFWPEFQVHKIMMPFALTE